jgi:hypothetical protein
VQATPTGQRASAVRAGRGQHRHLGRAVIALGAITGTAPGKALRLCVVGFVLGFTFLCFGYSVDSAVVHVIRSRIGSHDWPVTRSASPQGPVVALTCPSATLAAPDDPERRETTMSDTSERIGTERTTSRWNSGALVAAGLLAGAFLLVGITMPSQTTSAGTGSTGTQTTASTVADPATPHAASSTAASSTTPPGIVTLSADVDVDSDD